MYLPWIILINIILPTMLGVYTSLATMVLEADIQGSLAINGSLIQWVTITYVLSINSVVPLADSFINKYGAKNSFILAVLLFSLGSLFVPLSGSIYPLLFSRVLQGIGGGLLFPIGLALIVNIFPKQRLHIPVNLYMGGAFGGGVILGTVLSGYLGQNITWQWAFYFLTPIGILSSITAFFLFPESTISPPKAFDTKGYTCLIAANCSLIIALQNGSLKSTAEGWWSPYILAFFGLGLLFFLLLFFIETTIENPVLPLPLFKDPLFGLSCFTLFSLGLSIFATPLIIGKLLLLGLEYEKWQTGLTLAAFGFPFMVASAIASYLAQRISVSFLSCSGLTLLAISYYLNNSITIHSPRWAIVSMLAIRGVGVAITVGPVTTQGLRRVPKALTAQGSMILTYLRQLGAAYGGTILGIITIRRTIFHSERFFSTVNPYLPGYQNFTHFLKEFLGRSFGSTSLLQQEQSQMLVIHNIQRQALIQGINDAFFVLGHITSATIILLIGFSWYYANKEKKQARST